MFTALDQVERQVALCHTSRLAHPTAGEANEIGFLAVKSGGEHLVGAQQRGGVVAQLEEVVLHLGNSSADRLRLRPSPVRPRIPRRREQAGRRSVPDADDLVWLALAAERRTQNLEGRRRRRPAPDCARRSPRRRGSLASSPPGRQPAILDQRGPTRSRTGTCCASRRSTRSSWSPCTRPVRPSADHIVEAGCCRARG